MSQEKQLQQLQSDIILLKSRAFDLNEILGSREEELKQYRNLLGQICNALEIDGSEGVSPEAILGALNALKEPVPTPTEEQLLSE